ncbi:MAG: hypothetical protein U5K74_05980 [Gemmatimonadaceae bacterium]|nr:hypothetical protein [Gemmatimonadaceae bacterium]
MPACTTSTSGARSGEEPVAYALPELEPILSTTYGVITYQEQVMRIAQVLAGISLAEADVLRKAVGKKDAELIKKELGKFETKAVARGHDPKIIKELAGQIETFGRYGFNKCLVGDTEIYDASTWPGGRASPMFTRRALAWQRSRPAMSDSLRLRRGKRGRRRWTTAYARSFGSARSPGARSPPRQTTRSFATTAGDTLCIRRSHRGASRPPGWPDTGGVANA